MSHSFIYLPSDFVHASSFEVGSYAKQISNLLEIGIIMPQTLVIPVNTLKIIAQANNLQAKIYKIIQETNYNSSVSKESAVTHLKHLIIKQSIPKDLATPLLKTYHTYFGNSFISIKNSDRLPFPDIELTHIHSDTNFIDALLEVWADISAQKLSKLLLSINSIHDILFPCPILIQEQLEPKISGTACSFDLTDSSKNRITIRSAWGVYNTNQQNFDQYTVDVRTSSIITRQINTKLTQFRRVLGKLKTEDVLIKYQNQETINDQTIKKIAELTIKIKRKYFTQVEVQWCLQNDQIIIEKVAEADIAPYQTKNQQKLLYKIFTAINSGAINSKIAEQSDGLAILNSQNLLFASGSHPCEVAKTNQKKYLVEAIARTLTKYLQKTNKPLLYKANSSSSLEFEKLKFSSLYEVPELNPLLGYRGALRLLSQPEMFKIELDSILKTLQSVQKRVIFVLPFVRSPEELTYLVQTIQKTGLKQHKNFSVWMEISTPENIFNLSQYPLRLIDGILFNLQSIYTLTTGIDQNNLDIANRYSFNTLLLKSIIESAIHNASIPEVYIDFTVFNKTLLTELLELEITGFIVNAEVTSLIKTCIIDIQQNKIL